MRTLHSQLLSVALHIAVLALGVLIGSRTLVTSALKPQPQRPTVLYFPPPRLAIAARAQDSGGSNAGQAPARHGLPPPKFTRIFIPNLPEQPQPKLPLQASVDFDVLPVVPQDGIGDPLRGVTFGSLGIGGRDGIGERGCCGGIGQGEKGRGLNPGAATGVMTPPKLIYKVEPEFSEEARKAKFQGTVVLMIEVDSAGNASNFRIVSSPGLGLDEKAMEAVARWRFRPAYRDGKPVSSSARIEVNFRLL